MEMTPSGNDQGVSGKTWVVLLCIVGLIAWGIISLFSTTADQMAENRAARESEESQAAVSLTDEERFVLVTRNSEPGLSAVSDASLLAAGQAICDDLNAGTPIRTVFENALEGMQLGGAGDDATAWTGAIAGGAVYELCPAYQADMDELFAANS